MKLDKPIPTVMFPTIHDYEIDLKEEQLKSLKEEGFICFPYYYVSGIAGSINECYVRESVLELLKEARKKLPDNLDFKVYDAYRPIAVQQRLWDYYRSVVIGKNSGLSEDEIDIKTSFFVSKPSYDKNKPSLHNTGGAIDLTLIDKETGKELNMGTEFDDFTNRAWTNHFEPTYEEHEDNEEIMLNRRILYNVMIDTGFTNLPSEWWHYDYGTKFWGYFKNKPALYDGIIQHNFKPVFPIT